MSETRWQRDESWVGASVDDSFVMVNVDSGQYIALNATASAVWEALAEPATTADIATQMRAKYEVGESECDTAVERLLTQMHDLHLAAPL